MRINSAVSKKMALKNAQKFKIDSRYQRYDYDYIGRSFLDFPRFFTLLMFPKLVDNREALDVGIALRKNMGANCIYWLNVILVPK